MIDAGPGIRFDSAAFYTEYEVRQLGFTEAALRRARQAGELRCKEVARGQRVYLGRWLIDWLTGKEQPPRAP